MHAMFLALSPSHTPCIIPFPSYPPLVSPSVKSNVFFPLPCRSTRVVTQAPIAQKRDWVYMPLMLEAQGNCGGLGGDVKVPLWALLVLLAPLVRLAVGVREIGDDKYLDRMLECLPHARSQVVWATCNAKFRAGCNMEVAQSP